MSAEGAKPVETPVESLRQKDGAGYASHTCDKENLHLSPELSRKWDGLFIFSKGDANHGTILGFSGSRQ
jgi:hypothetical protein